MSPKRIYIYPPLILWFFLSMLLNALGYFEADPSKPPIPMLLAVIGPPTIFAILYLSSGPFRDAVLSLDLRLMTAMQAWRLVGVIFLVLYFYSLLPGVFAWPAGVGDILVGLYAPFVVAKMARDTSNWLGHAIGLNILGLLDFVGAIGAGVLSSGSPGGVLSGPVTSDIMLDLPLALIPTFLVPFWIILHICSLIQLRRSPVRGSVAHALNRSG